MQGNYAQHIANGGCPSRHGDYFCADTVHHELPPPTGRGNLHWAKLFNPVDGSSTLEWA